MSDYLIDWATMPADGTVNLTSGGETVAVTIATPTNSSGQSATTVGSGSFFGTDALKPSSNVSTPVVATISFDQEVENVTFEIFDLDSKSGCWDDKVTVIALDADGNQVPVTFSNLYNHTVDGNSIEGNGNYNEGVDGSGAQDSVTVTIAGPIVSLQLIYDNGDSASHSGTIGYGDIGFDLACDPLDDLDGIVEGTAGNDVIDYDYLGDPDGDRIDHNDAILPGETGNDDIVEAGAGDDLIKSGDGNDEVFAGSGNDTVEGGAGNDVIYGDSNYGSSVGGTVRESFEWNLAPDPNSSGAIDDGDTLAGGFSQDTGNVTVTFSVDGTCKTPTTTFADNQQKVHSITDDGSPVDAYSSLSSELNEKGESATYNLAFSDTVENISFRVNDIDFDSQVTIKAYDAAGNLIPVDITGGSKLTLKDLDGVAGKEFIENNSCYSGADTDPANSILVNIAGPVARLEIIHTESGSHASGINITDVYFDVTVGDTGPDGNDTLLGGDGDDIIYGEGGNDILYGGTGEDQIHGGDGDDIISGGAGADYMRGQDDRDTFIGGTAGDFADGGEGGVDYDTLDLTGAGPLHIIYDTNPEDGTVEFRDDEGNVTGTMTFRNIENVIPCFTPGTTIATPRGERLVEELKVGDKIITRDNGIQEIRWLGAKHMDWKALAAHPHLKPILIQKGALGNGLPERDMMVSPNHRVLVSNDQTMLYFEEREVLAAAKHLVNNRGIHEVDTIGTTYVHFMFDQHEVVLSNGSWTESFQPGDYTLKGIGNSQRSEILELFPELKTEAGMNAYSAARKTLKKHEAQLLLK